MSEEGTFLFRLPVELKDKLAASAEQNGRSMNSELMKALQSYLGRGDSSDADVRAMCLKAAIQDGSGSSNETVWTRTNGFYEWVKAGTHSVVFLGEQSVRYKSLD